MVFDSKITEETAASLVDGGKYVEAFNQYVALAENESITAQLRVAWMYETANGVVKNLQEAEKWYLKAAATGLPYPQFLVGNFYRRMEHYEDSVPWLVSSEAQGYLPAAYALGVLYHYGAGVARDRQKALEYFQKASHRGHVFAMREVAVAMIRGEGGVRQVAAGILLGARALWQIIRIGITDPQSDLIVR